MNRYRAREIRQEKEIKSTKSIRGKIHLFVDDMVLYVENYRLCTRKS